ncbi:DUF805 domain-containing protein [Rhodanobacter geophilus]|uniref:DUF805 domain-containing protein n=1 Tax=Rhodanobacter geophilus TaxID=3162488 RepID=A0ABV3QQ72_9GAMM
MRRVREWIEWRGRMGRLAFLWRLAAAATVFVVLFVFLESVAGYASTLVLYPPFFAVLSSLAVRRLHDSARSAWHLLAPIVPVLGPVYLAGLLLFARGTQGDNQYGDDPRSRNRDYLQVSIHEPA